jgi:hypothetical protein
MEELASIQSGLQGNPAAGRPGTQMKDDSNPGGREC